MFTGDRSGDWLYAALHRAGYASQPTSVGSGDGLAAERRAHRRRGALRATGQQAHAGGARHLRALAGPRPRPRGADRCASMLALGASAGTPRWPAPAGSAGPCPGRSRGSATAPRWCWSRADGKPIRLLGSYHVSQQNTFTGKLTEEMLDAVSLGSETVGGRAAASLGASAARSGEPSMPQQIIAVTVLGDDRPGIVADVTAALAGPARQPRGLHDDPAARPLRDGRPRAARSRDADVGRGGAEPLTAGGSSSSTPARCWPSHDRDSRRSGVLAAGARRRPARASSRRSTRSRRAQHGANIVDLGTRLGGDLYVMTAELQVARRRTPPSRWSAT